MLGGIISLHGPHPTFLTINQPHDWNVEAKRPKSNMVEVWRRNAPNQAMVFSLLSGGHAQTGIPHLDPRRETPDKSPQMRIRDPKKYTKSFVATTADRSKLKMG